MPPSSGGPNSFNPAAAQASSHSSSLTSSSAAASGSATAGGFADGVAEITEVSQLESLADEILISKAEAARTGDSGKNLIGREVSPTKTPAVEAILRG